MLIERSTSYPCTVELFFRIKSVISLVFGRYFYFLLLILYLSGET